MSIVRMDDLTAALELADMMLREEITSRDEAILHLNDCEITQRSRINTILVLADVLLRFGIAARHSKLPDTVFKFTSSTGGGNG